MRRSAQTERNAAWSQFHLSTGWILDVGSIFTLRVWSCEKLEKRRPGRHTEATLPHEIWGFRGCSLNFFTLASVLSGASVASDMAEMLLVDHRWHWLVVPVLVSASWQALTCPTDELTHCRVMVFFYSYLPFKYENCCPSSLHPHQYPLILSNVLNIFPPYPIWMGREARPAGLHLVSY